MKRKTEDRSLPAEATTKAGHKTGSAILLAIVLTSLLAIIGVMFLLSSRVESVATSAISENKDLTLAVDTAVAAISQSLAIDVNLQSDPNRYCDYPDPCNPFLACLEPYYDGLNYRWSHITDIYGRFLTANIPAITYPDYQDRAQVRDSNPVDGMFPADADGDGVGDSMWVRIPSVTSSKGKPIFAAIRVIDNGGMLNVNTGFKFDPCNPTINDGSSQTQINLYALSNLDQTHTAPGEKENRLLSYRSGSEPNNLDLYEQKVIWQYKLPIGVYTPFDISDEFVLRNRYILNNDQMTTRIENLWADSFKDGLEQPISTPSEINSAPRFWVHRVGYDSFDPCIYDYRHIATTYNYDRIIAPDGNKMFNINKSSPADPNYIRNMMAGALVEGGSLPVNADILGAQITANLIDYIDGPNYPPSDPRYDRNDNVTVVYDSANNPHYGFETPCVYISELAQNFFQPEPNEPNLVYYSYAIELFKPYWEDDEPNGWQLVINNSDLSGSVTPISWTGSRRFHVIANIDVNAPIDINLNEPTGPNEVNLFDPNKFPRVAKQAFIDFNGSSTIWLQRNVNGAWLTVDEAQVLDANLGTGWLEPNSVGNASHSFERDLTLNRCFRRMWAPMLTHDTTVGFMNTFVGEIVPGGSPYWTDTIQAHPANQSFTNVGEFGQLFYRTAYNFGGEGPWDGIDEPNMRIDLALSAYQRVFKYLTVMDPCDHGWPGETRIKGRININTAPWYVLAQLPWVSWLPTDPLNYRLAQAIVAYRDKTVTSSGADFRLRANSPGFQSIGQLNNVFYDTDPCSSIGYYAQTNNVFPAMTPADGAGDKFEERDAIFARISNLVTVRSDVFTAYILVRIGPNGPQKRAIAILDRSGVTSAGGKVKIVAIQMVPDPH